MKKILAIVVVLLPFCVFGDGPCPTCQRAGGYIGRQRQLWRCGISQFHAVVRAPDGRDIGLRFSAQGLLEEAYLMPEKKVENHE